MNTVDKKVNIITLLLILVTFFLLLFIFNAAVFKVYIAEAEEVVTFDDTAVMSDLDGAIINGVLFNAADYPVNAEKDLEVLQLAEFGYAKYFNNMQDYGLYVYLYNPAGIVINDTSIKNKIKIADSYTVDGDAASYDFFTLRFCNKYENRFYKFKVLDKVGADGKKIVERVNSDKRIYHVSDIELAVKGSEEVAHIQLGQTYYFEGFAKGYGIEDVSTLVSSKNYLETIILEVHPTWYRVPGQNENGKGHQWQISSVYFSVPKKYKLDYGDLIRVFCHWYEYKTTKGLVLSNNTIYQALYNDRFVTLDDRASVYKIGSGYYRNNNEAFDRHEFVWSYNVRPFSNPSAFGGYYVVPGEQSFSVPIVLHSTEMEYEDALHDYLLAYDKPGDSKEVTERYELSSSLFIDSVDSGRVRGFNAKDIDIDADVFNLGAYDDNHNFWDRWHDFGWKVAINNSEQLTIAYSDQKPIVEISQSSAFLDDEVFKEKYLTKDAALMKTFISESYDNDEIPFLLRFGVNDYYSAGAVYDTVEYDNQGNYLDNVSLEGSCGYVFQETVFFDFRVINLTFARDGVETVIPVVSDPTNLAVNATPPIQVEPGNPEDIITDEINNLWNGLWGKVKDFFIGIWTKHKWVFIVLLCCIGLAILIPIISLIIKVLSAPFKATRSIGRAVDRNHERKKDKYKHKNFKG